MGLKYATNAACLLSFCFFILLFILVAFVESPFLRCKELITYPITAHNVTT